MQVTIDGVPYAPACVVSSRIGIAISTHQRADVLKRALEQHMKHLPAGALVVVVDDGSKPAAVVPHGVQLLRHETSLGIVASKNASLSALMDAGCEHLFLWDDDAWPIADNWHLPYIESPEPHLAYQFLDLAGRNKLHDMAELYRDDKHVAYTGQRGVMLSYHRSAIEKVGGFDPVYGRGMYEHSDLALRIHNAGLTTWAYADVVGSEKLIHSLDEHEAVERSVPRPDRQALVERNVKIHNERRDTGYTGYKTGTTAVPDETFTTNGLVIGESASSQTSDLNIVNLIVRGFQSCITVTGPNSYLLKFDNLHCGVAWFRGFAWTASSNSGENIQFFGGSIYNCINTAGTAQGLYIAPTASSVELILNGTSFDYNDVDISHNLGNVTLNDCHMENNNNNPKITISNTASKEPSKLKINGGAMGGGPGTSSINATVESATGRPCYIDITSAGTSVVIDRTQVGNFYTAGNVTQVVRNSGNNTVRKLELNIIQNTGPALTEGWPLNPSFSQNLLTLLGSGSISGWTLNTANGVSLVANTSVSASHDSGARQMDRSSVGTATGMSYYQDVRVRNGKTMLLKAWLQTQSIISIGGTATIQTTFLNEDKTVTVLSSALSQRQVTADNTLTECAYVAPVPAGAAWMRFAVYVTNIPTGTASRIYGSGERVWEI